MQKKLWALAVAQLIKEFFSHDDGAAGEPHAHEGEDGGSYVKKVFFEQSRSTLRCFLGGVALKILVTRGASYTQRGRGYCFIL
jgi:hypothetical protein